MEKKRKEKTQIQYYEKLFDLFSKNRANGESSISAKKKVRHWEREREDSINLEENVDGFNEFSICQM